MLTGHLVIDGLKIPFKKIPEESLRLLRDGYYENLEIQLIEKHLPNKVFVLELGTSIGIVSCHILKKQPVRLLTFEPVKKWAIIARQIVALNFESAPIEVVEISIGQKNQKEAILQCAAENNLLGRITGSTGVNTITVPSISLFDLNKMYAVPYNAWLVMDIEGMEWDIAKNQLDDLKGYKGIIVECHEVVDGFRTISASEVLEAFICAGFKLAEKAVQGNQLIAVLIRIE